MELSKSLSSQITELVMITKERIDTIMEEDRVGEFYNDERTEPLLEEWWEWIVGTENDVLFVPEEFKLTNS
tara:strand:+ start:1248 stop:1460 length:213 start_codon:yes stop_codon:yes gene_type:complete